MVRPMKKSVLLAGLVLLLATACHQFDPDAFGGHTDTTDHPVREYMLYLTDHLVAASLEELETALQMDPQDAATQSMYVVQGDLAHGNGVWTVRRECALKGLVMRNVIRTEGLTGWLLAFEGDVEISGSAYPTRFTVQAERAPTQVAHTDWKVTKFSGTRTEIEGYRCTFDATTALDFEALESDYKIWNAYGTVHMNVYKNDDLIDNAFLSLKGAPSAAIFVHGLKD